MLLQHSINGYTLNGSSISGAYIGCRINEEDATIGG
jgi:hypothetical protein